MAFSNTKDPMDDGFDGSTVYTVMTPPETIAGDVHTDNTSIDACGETRLHSSSVPWPGSTFIIRCVSSGQVITLLDGQVMLAPPGGPGSIHWTCTESKGWLGFRNLASSHFLGHDKHGKLCCTAGRQSRWEYFEARMRPDGGYVLLLTHFDRLWHLGFKVECGQEKLAKLGDGGSGGAIWEFVKV